MHCHSGHRRDPPPLHKRQGAVLSFDQFHECCFTDDWIFLVMYTCESLLRVMDGFFNYVFNIWSCMIFQNAGNSYFPVAVLVQSEVMD